MYTWNRTDLSHEALKAWQTAHPELDPNKKTMPKATKNHDYDTPTAQQTAEQFRAELRADLDAIRADLDAIRADLDAIRAGLAQAAGAFAEMTIDNIIMTYSDAGKPAYKASGKPYKKFGVRVWEEVLPTLGIDPAALKPGPNPIAPTAARVLLVVNDDGKSTPRKVIGKA